ncbi:MAG: AAA family ATPase [Lachnospiraceae bacterium]|nr:AAA family ATPase [Lachnospiraceae bacterium]
MNIKQAKDYIENTVRLYLKKDEFGEYRIPVVRQRPIFLLGAPGIGKTAVMEQIAQDLSVALVSYSMTHHTRQSALGLPFISHKEYKGMNYDVSEYTMSEIIASIYEVMENTGIEEGILFLDEINCVSETLAPSMLQFLQYKVFGRHKVPDGWVIVTAGNPPEYNKSVREFDVVTMDRLKVLSVEADYKVWKEYGQQKGLHPSVLNFLELKKEYFYKIETTVNGRSYVTARGWEDLSEILYLYEEEGMKIDETLIEQYLRNERVVKEFAAYYDLFNKYKKEYQTEEILAGTAMEQTTERARVAAFDERLSLLGMLTDKVLSEIRENMEDSDYLVDLSGSLKAIRAALEKFKQTRDGSLKSDKEQVSISVISMLENQANARKKRMESLQMAGSLSEAERRKGRKVIRFLEETGKELMLSETGDNESAFLFVKLKFDKQLAELKAGTQKTKQRLSNLFTFVENAFAEGNEMLILLTELTVNNHSARFISQFGCEAYEKHNKEMMLSERSSGLQAEIEALDLEGIL